MSSGVVFEERKFEIVYQFLKGLSFFLEVSLISHDGIPHLSQHLTTLEARILRIEQLALYLLLNFSHCLKLHRISSTLKTMVCSFWAKTPVRNSWGWRRVVVWWWAAISSNNLIFFSLLISEFFLWRRSDSSALVFFEAVFSAFNFYRVASVSSIFRVNLT